MMALTPPKSNTLWETPFYLMPEFIYIQPTPSLALFLSSTWESLLLAFLNYKTRWLFIFLPHLFLANKPSHLLVESNQTPLFLLGSTSFEER